MQDDSPFGFSPELCEARTTCVKLTPRVQGTKARGLTIGLWMWSRRGFWISVRVLCTGLRAALIVQCKSRWLSLRLALPLGMLTLACCFPHLGALVYCQPSSQQSFS